MYSWLTLAVQVAGVIVLVVYAVDTHEIRTSSQKQATTAFEDDLTKQYRGIMKSIPVDISTGSGLETLTSNRERLAGCRDAIYRYVDLTNEQIFLHDKGRVADETWTGWFAGIKSNMKLPAFRQVWEEVSQKRPESFTDLRELLRS